MGQDRDQIAPTLCPSFHTQNLTTRMDSGVFLVQTDPLETLPWPDLGRSHCIHSPAHL